MHFDVMTRADSWQNVATFARDVERVGNLRFIAALDAIDLNDYV